MDSTRPHRRILRSPSVKRRSKGLPVNQRVQLQRVLGVTVSSNASLSCDPNSGTIAYPAGCVVVLFNPRRNKQSHIFNATKKTVTCLAFSRDGKHLVTGETGHQPAVRIWDVQLRMQVAEFRGHKFGISCVAFSPNMKEVVSVGTQHDMMVNVWNWKTGNKVASNKVSSKVSALTFSEDGKCFITVGNRHVRFWYLEDKRSKINQTVPLMGRSGILGNQKDNFFCDVVAGRGDMCGRFFVITQSGLLCEFNEKRQLDKWVELRTKTASCITAGQEHIFVGCAEGVIRVFSAKSLQFICSLPKPHHLGVEVTTATNPNHMMNTKENAKYPDTKAITIDDDHKKVTCIYNDRSVYTWDVHDVKRTGKVSSFLYHSACIWALEMYPPLDDETKAMLPPGSFMTASADDTIRVWNLTTHMPENTAFKRNIYSNELLKIVYVDPSLSSLCSVDYNPAGGTDKTDTTYEGKNGVRSIRVSPDGADLASGDRQGNIRIYDMQYLSEKKSVEAHESDVMCLEYSYSSCGRFLATSSRDRLIHVFDVDENYGLVQSLGDHSSSITAVRFTNVDDKLQMISCGADKSILIRNAVTSPDFQFQLEHHLATKITLYDMVIDPTQKFLATACQDRNVRLYNIQTTKERKCYRGSVGDEGVLLRIHLDPSGSYAATTGTDKNVCIVDFNTGELVATMYGHSEVITGVKFANDLKHLITVSADGCIFVWRLPREMTNQIKGRLHEMGKPVRETDFIKSDQPLSPNLVTVNNSARGGHAHLVKSVSTGHIVLPDNIFDNDTSQTNLDFSTEQLPSWAKVKFGEAHSKGSGNSQEQVRAKGKWAQRADNSVEFKSQLDVTSLEDSFTDQLPNVETGFNTLPRMRRKTVILDNVDKRLDLPHIDDSFVESPGDLCSSLPTTTKFNGLGALRKSENCDQYKSDTSLNISHVVRERWSDRFDILKSNSIDDIDDLDTESDSTEIIYMPSDPDSDTFASTYKVIEVDDEKHSNSSSRHGSISVQDEASVSTDNTSVEDEEDTNDETVIISGPTSPSVPEKEFVPGTPEKTAFAREKFVEDSFTPVPLEKFTRSLDNLDSLDKQAPGDIAAFVFESSPFSPRMSLSARFMSRAQTPLQKNSSSCLSPFHQGSWFNRNKKEMIKAMDETRRSLLAMKLRSNSSGSESPTKENSPSPPIKLEGEECFPDDITTKATYSISPQTGAENSTTNSPADLSLSKLKVNPQSPLKASSCTVSSLCNARSNEKHLQFIHTAFKNSSKQAARIGPISFKPTQNKAKGENELSSKSDSFCDKLQELYKRKVRRRARLTERKIFASTPNLTIEHAAGDNKSEEKAHIKKSTSTFDLRLLQISTKYTQDLSEADSSQFNSRVADSCLSVVAHSKKTSEFSLDVNKPSQIIQVSPSPVLPTQTANSSALFIQGRPDAAVTPQRHYQKAVVSELTLDQSKRTCFSKSSVLVDSNNVTDSSFVACKSVNKFRECEFSNLSSSAENIKQFSTVFERGSVHASPTLQAVAEDIEHTANLLHVEKQTDICNTISEFLLSRSSNLDASPLDLPERDQPSKRSSSPSSCLPLLLQHSSQHLSKSFQNHHHTVSSHISSDHTYLISKESHDKDLDDVFEECKETYKDKGHKCDCIGSHGSQMSGRETICNMCCHVLPTSHNMTVIQESHSDTGVGSESSDTDTSQASLVISTSGAKSIHNSKTKTYQSSDTSGLTLQLSSSLSPAPVSVTHCQSMLCDFRSQLHMLRDLFTQVCGKTDDTAVQVVTMLGDVFHETQDIIADLVTKLPDQTEGNKDALLLKLSSSVSHDYYDKTFHCSAPTSPPDDTTVVSRDVAFLKSNSLREIAALKDKSALQIATKDMLQPIVSQLSQDLSEGIWKLIRERLD